MSYTELSENLNRTKGYYDITEEDLFCYLYNKSMARESNGFNYKYGDDTIKWLDIKANYDF